MNFVNLCFVESDPGGLRIEWIRMDGVNPRWIWLIETKGSVRQQYKELYYRASNKYIKFSFFNWKILKFDFEGILSFVSSIFQNSFLK